MPGKTCHVVIGVVATDRLAGLGRLLASLEPVADDPELHLLVLDNGAADAVEQVLLPFASNAAGVWRSDRSSTPLLPLHSSRRELSKNFVALGIEDAPAVFWLIDDDVAFEQVGVRDGKLTVENVARLRVAQVRALAARAEYDLVVSGFTGDPPVRPESVISPQIFDLECELNRMFDLAPISAYPTAPPAIERYVNDYYYAHRSPGGLPLEKPFPWISTGERSRTSAEELAIILEASLDIEAGRGVFRPLLDSDFSEQLQVESCNTPNRGGNAVFLSENALHAHRYPSIQVPGGFSRRGDMIGSALLARRGYRVAVANLTLRHDRRGQPRVGDVGEDRMREFAGVMLARLIMKDTDGKGSPGELLEEFVQDRASRIRNDASRGFALAERTLEVIENRPTSWRTAVNVTHFDELSESLRRICQHFKLLERDDLLSATREVGMREIVLAAHEQLSRMEML